MFALIRTYGWTLRHQPSDARYRVPSVMLRPLFLIIVLVGSFLLFLIQPMFARMVIPRLGGSPSVWNVAMLFYQTVLLSGYLYADALQRLTLRRQITVHLTLFVLTGLTLPVAAATWLPDPGTLPPALWLLTLLAVSIGPVFLVISAQAPLMQAWFARSNDPAAGTPYFLYAASNVGSLAALLAYPLLSEPDDAAGDAGLGVVRWVRRAARACRTGGPNCAAASGNVDRGVSGRSDQSPALTMDVAHRDSVGTAAVDDNSPDQ